MGKASELLLNVSASDIEVAWAELLNFQLAWQHSILHCYEAMRWIGRTFIDTIIFACLTPDQVRSFEFIVGFRSLLRVHVGFAN